MKDFFRQNGGLLLVIAVLVGLLVGVVSLFSGGMANPISNILGIISTPVRNGLNSFASWTEEKYADAFLQEEMKEENRRLKEELATMQAQAREGEAASRENQRLRNLLGLREKRKDFDLESATVTARGSSNWEATLTLSKGESADIAPEDCVVDEYGNLVGVVKEVGQNWCTVVTVIDSDLEMGGLIARTDGAAILEGDFGLMSQEKLKLSYLPENSELIAGDMVLTSGKGGVYPAGLVVGHVEDVFTEVSGMSRYAVIIPETDLAALKQVFVIKSFDIVD